MKDLFVVCTLSPKTNGFGKGVEKNEGAEPVVNELYKTAVHNLLVQHCVCEQSNLV